MHASIIRVALGVCVLLTATVPAAAADTGMSSREIIANSVAYHDPQGVWERGEIRLGVRTVYSEEYAKRAGAPEASVELLLAPALHAFGYTKTAGEDVIEYALRDGAGTVTVNGSTDITEEDRERLRLAEPELYRDYFEYLYGMPMKLGDPGTNPDARAMEMQFNDRDTWAVRVTYDAEVGDDIWDFFFDKTTFALTGYRFFHDESKNDGEYITFEGEVHDEATGIRLPRTRAWFFNADDNHLATDDVTSMEVRTP